MVVFTTHFEPYVHKQNLESTQDSIHFLCLNNFLVRGDCRREYFRAWVLSSKTINNNS